MAKATITTASGTQVKIEGTSDEVAAVLEKLEKAEAKPSAGGKKKQVAKGGAKRKAAAGLSGHVEGLVESEFFKQPKDFAALRKALAELGHYYPPTSLSPVLLRLVKSRRLRRMKENKRWVYVQ